MRSRHRRTPTGRARGQRALDRARAAFGRRVSTLDELAWDAWPGALPMEALGALQDGLRMAEIA